MYCIRYRDLLSLSNWNWWWMALWALMWQYGFILDLWLLLAIISIPWGYIVLEPLLALRGGAGDLIYLSQGRRDHPSKLLYGIILCSPVLFPLWERRNTNVACSSTPVKQCWGSISTIRNGAQRKLHLNAFLKMQLKKKCVYIYTKV